MTDGAVPEADEPTKSPWNSLEVAKLLMNAATPIALFVLGYIVSQQSSKAAAEQEQSIRAAARTDQLAAEQRAFGRERMLKDEVRRDQRLAEARSVARQNAIREESRRDAAEASRQAHLRERALWLEREALAKQLHEEGIARDDRLRGEAEAREATNRRQAQEEAAGIRIEERRNAAWSQVAGLMGAIHAAFRRLLRAGSAARRQSDLDGILENMSRADAIIGSQTGRFSDSFYVSYAEYSASVEVAHDALSRRAGTSAPRLLGMCFNQVHNSLLQRGQLEIEGRADGASTRRIREAAPPHCQRLDLPPDIGAWWRQMSRLRDPVGFPDPRSARSAATLGGHGESASFAGAGR